MTIWHDMAAAELQPAHFLAVTANTKQSRIILKFDPETGLLKLDGFLDDGTCFPLNTGYIPRTCSENGMPLEGILLCGQPLPPMTLTACRTVGVLDMVLEDGSKRRRIVAAVNADEVWSARLTIDEIAPEVRKSMIRFYKGLQTAAGQQPSITELNGLAEAELLIEDTMERYRIRYCGKLR